MNLSTKITAFLIEQNIVSTKNKEVYEYGFDLLIADFINFSIILLIGTLCCKLWKTILYLIIFVGLRSVCGGYHAKTHLKCHIYDHSFPLRGKAPKENETQVPLTQQVVIC